MGQGAALLFGLYVLNIISGKVSTTAGMQPPVRLGDVAELLLLFGAVILFVATTLLAEASAKADASSSHAAHSPSDIPRGS
jgi:hypothetical protein